MESIARSTSYRALLAASIAFIAACSSSTAPAANPCSPVVAGAGGHPAGLIDSVYPIVLAPFGVAVNGNGTVLVGRQAADNVYRGSIANFVFTDSIAAGSDPGSMAAAANCSTMLVSNYNDFTVGVLDLTTNVQSTTLSAGSQPDYIKFDPQNTKIYVATQSTGVRVFDANTLDSIKTISAGSGLNGIAFNGAGTKLYVSSLGSNTVAEIDAQSDSILRFINVGTHPQEVAVSVDNTELWVADENIGVQVYALPAGTFITTVPGTAGAFGLALTPDGTQLYATLAVPGTIKIIDRVGRSVFNTLTAGRPRRIAFDREGAHAVIADETLGAILIK